MPASRPRVLLTRPLAAPIQAAMKQHFALCAAPQPLPEAIAETASTFRPHAIVARDDLPESICELAPELLHIARHGVGLDVIPLAACERHQISLSNVPGGNAISVAEWCLAQMLALLHRLPQIAESMRAQGWDGTRAAFSGKAEDLAGRTVGLIGCGAIGGALARMLSLGMGVRVIAFTRTPARLPAFVQAVSLAECLAQADVLVPCVPLTEATRGLVDATAIAAMKPGALLINASRGEVLDESALIAALRDGRLAGAALDVIAARRAGQSTGLPALPNLVVTPHLAGHTADAALRNGESVLQALQAVLLRGEKPQHLIDDRCWNAVMARRARLMADWGTSPVPGETR